MQRDSRLWCVCAVLCLLVLLTPVRGEQVVRFTITNPATVPATTVVGVSLPVPAGVIRKEAPKWARVAERIVPTQATVITRHPDGSVRRVMLRMELGLKADQTVAGYYPEGPTAGEPTAMSAQPEPKRRWQVISTMERIELRALDGELLAEITPFGPDSGAAPARLNIIEKGPLFTWLRYSRVGSKWGREKGAQAP